MRPAALNTRAITGDAIGRSRLISARPDVGVGRGLPSTTAGGGVPEGTPVMVVGMNVATFEYELKDPDGKTVATHFVTATSGTGMRGTFDFTVPYQVDREGLGELIVYERSAANGKRTHVSEVPIYLEK